MSDAVLLRLEAKFNANSDREERAANEVEALEAESNRLRKRIRKAERKLHRLTQKGSRLFQEVLAARASSLEGAITKVRIRDRWNTDEEASEIAILRSLIVDLRALADIQS